MVGPLPAGRPWTVEEEAQLVVLVRSGMKAPAIARQLKRSAGAVHARINRLKLKGVSFPSISLPSERLAFFRAHVSGRGAKPKH